MCCLANCIRCAPCSQTGVSDHAATGIRARCAAYQSLARNLHHRALSHHPRPSAMSLSTSFVFARHVTCLVTAAGGGTGAADVRGGPIHNGMAFCRKLACCLSTRVPTIPAMRAWMTRSLFHVAPHPSHVVSLCPQPHATMYCLVNCTRRRFIHGRK